MNGEPLFCQFGSPEIAPSDACPGNTELPRLIISDHAATLVKYPGCVLTKHSPDCNFKVICMQLCSRNCHGALCRTISIFQASSRRPNLDDIAGHRLPSDVQQFQARQSIARRLTTHCSQQCRWRTKHRNVFALQPWAEVWPKSDYIVTPHDECPTESERQIGLLYGRVVGG